MSNQSSFKDVYDRPDGLFSAKYLTQEELDAYNEQNGTQFSGLKLGKNPETGELGIFSFDPLFGWRDDTKWLGPRTHYEDGSPVNFGGPSFKSKMDWLKGQPDSVVRDALPSMPVQETGGPDYTALNPMMGMLIGGMPLSFQRNFLVRDILNNSHGKY